ncbi:MAG: lytic transglycosylase domain-containing protein, partial [Defluviimonas sp.]|nr:lytic transglycosylase domain-containing protein [Defluviimonas sp.]
ILTKKPAPGLAAPRLAEDAAALGRALAAAAQGNWAVAMGQARLAGPVSTDILEWQRLRAGAASATFADYVDFLDRRPDWPGLSLLRKKGEAAMLEGEPAASVLAYFAAAAPQTGTGSLALMTALVQSRRPAQADAEAVRAWRDLSLTEEEQAALLARAGAVLADHHGGRLAAALDDGRLAEARRMLPLVTPGSRAVAEARIALQSQATGVDALIAAVPAHMAGSAGLARDRFRWRIARNRYDEAADLLLERSASADLLGEPAAWAGWRAILARREMRLGDPGKAYRLASTHHLTSGSSYADLEWLAGYIALRRLDDPETALAHFARFRAAVASPISLGRAGYWQGRALDALQREGEARAAYAFAAQYQTGFYGLLAAERLGLPLDAALTGREAYPGLDGAAFAASPVFESAELLYAAGESDLGERFLLHLAESLGPEELQRLAGHALRQDRPHLALMVAKSAAAQGLVLPAAYFPLNGLEKMDLPVAPELALSIARRESEFDIGVISHVGARGLMQVMPATAQLMAAATGQPYAAARLTSDWRYNASLGSAYLAQLTGEFGTAAALVAAGYNAGPGRPRQWIREMGDPRDPSVDVVDWVEAIPFTETQNYVMRVAESLPIYRARLTGEAGPVRLTGELTGR